jgi:hypothetical protein
LQKLGLKRMFLHAWRCSSPSLQRRAHRTAGDLPPNCVPAAPPLDALAPSFVQAHD